MSGLFSFNVAAFKLKTSILEVFDAIFLTVVNLFMQL